MGPLPQPGLNETLERILAICQKMNSERELGPLLDLIAHEATSFLDCDRASIFPRSPRLGFDEACRIE